MGWSGVVADKAWTGELWGPTGDNWFSEPDKLVFRRWWVGVRSFGEEWREEAAEEAGGLSLAGSLTWTAGRERGWLVRGGGEGRFAAGGGGRFNCWGFTGDPEGCAGRLSAGATSAATAALW